MNRTPVSSSNIASVGYDSGSSTLQIEFNNGKLYDYYSVPEEIYNEIINTGSPGGYFHSHIKNVFSFQEV